MKNLQFAQRLTLIRQEILREYNYSSECEDVCQAILAIEDGLYPPLDMERVAGMFNVSIAN